MTCPVKVNHCSRCKKRMTPELRGVCWKCHNDSRPDGFKVTLEYLEHLRKERPARESFDIYGRYIPRNRRET